MKIYIRDNGGRSFDRYTAYIRNTKKRRDWAGDSLMIAFSDNWDSPQGFCQHTAGRVGNHLGQLIAFEQLDKRLQAYLIECFTPEELGQ